MWVAEYLLPPALVVTQDSALMRITKKSYKTKLRWADSYLNWITVVQVVRTSALLKLSVSPKCQNCCYTLFRIVKWFDVFGLICPMLQTRIGGDSYLSETSSPAKTFGKVQCFGE